MLGVRLLVDNIKRTVNSFGLGDCEKLKALQSLLQFPSNSELDPVKVIKQVKRALSGSEDQIIQSVKDLLTQ